MKTKTATILIILLAFAALSYAQKTDYTLTAEESQAWAQLAADEKANREAHGQAIMQAVNVPVGADSQAVHSAVKSSWLAMNLLASRRGEFLARLQAQHSCAGCQIVDGKLIKGPVGK